MCSYFYRKFVYPTSEVLGFRQGGPNWPYYRIGQSGIFPQTDVIAVWSGEIEICHGSRLFSALVRFTRLA